MRLSQRSNFECATPKADPAIPVILYTADDQTLAQSSFQVAVWRNPFDVSPLLPVLSHVSGLIYCGHCQRYISPNEAAWLVRPARIFCQSCTRQYYSNIIVPGQAVTKGNRALETTPHLFPAHLLALAAASPFIVGRSQPTSAKDFQPTPVLAQVIELGVPKGTARRWAWAKNKDFDTTTTSATLLEVEGEENTGLDVGVATEEEGEKEEEGNNNG